MTMGVPPSHHMAGWHSKRPRVVQKERKGLPWFGSIMDHHRYLNCTPACTATGPREGKPSPPSMLSSVRQYQATIETAPSLNKVAHTTTLQAAKLATSTPTSDRPNIDDASRRDSRQDSKFSSSCGGADTAPPRRSTVPTNMSSLPNEGNAAKIENSITSSMVGNMLDGFQSGPTSSWSATYRPAAEIIHRARAARQKINDASQSDSDHEVEKEDEHNVFPGFGETTHQEKTKESIQKSPLEWQACDENQQDFVGGSDYHIHSFEEEHEIIFSVGSDNEEHEIVFLSDLFPALSVVESASSFKVLEPASSEGWEGETSQSQVNPQENFGDDNTVRRGNVSIECILPPQDLEYRQDSFDSAAASLLLDDLLCREDVRNEISPDETDLLLDLLLLK